MLYEEYEKKIASKAKTLKFFWRFRFLFISIAVVVVASSGTLVGTRGLMKDVKTLEKQYVYGENYKYNSTSFLSTAQYEFTEFEKSEWDSKAPTLVGKYKMRSKGQNSFGSFYYGKEQVFEIVPKAIDVSAFEDAITYGELPSIRIDDKLVYGDSLGIDYTFTYSDKTQPTWDVTPVLESLHIYNEQGEDVTYCYSLTPVKKALSIITRSITVTSSSASKVYDGEELTEKGFSIVSGSLVKGDSLVVTGWSSITNASTLANTHTYKVFNENDEDMTIHYNIKENKGNLEITKRPISFSSPDIDTTYDGTNYKNYLNKISYNEEDLVKGHEVEFSYSSGTKYVKAGHYENEFKVKIVKDDVDYTENYDISFTYGETKINKRDLVISSASYEKTYDAIPLLVTDIDIISGSLAEKDMFDVNASSFTESGVYDNEINAKIIDKVTGDDFSDCYNVSLGSGKITINPVNLTFNIIKNEVTYDGKPHTNEFELTVGSLVGTDYYEEKANQEKIDAGTYDNNSLEIAINKVDGTSNDHNYNITITGQEEALVINKRPITVKTISKEKLYDGKSLLETDTDETCYEVTSGTLAENEYIDFRYLNDAKNAGTVKIQSEVKIYHQAGETADKTKDKVVTSNYEITFDDGDFTINKRNIYIKTLDTEHVYNRVTAIPKELVTYEVTSDGDGLAEKQKISSLNITCEGINVGSYNYVIDTESLVISDEKNVNVTSNYNVTFVNTGKLTITKRPITVSMVDDSAIYDGKSHTFTTHNVTNLLEEDFLQFTGLPSVKHTWDGYVLNEPGTTTVHMENGDDVTENYEISFDTIGSVHIEPRPITFQSPSFTKYFDGTPIDIRTLSIVSGSLAEGDRYEIVSLSSFGENEIVHAGNYVNEFEVKMYNEDDLDVTEDYLIGKISGDIVIKPLPLTMDVFEHHYVYDGVSHTFNYDQVAVGKMTNPIYLDSSSNNIPANFFIDVHLSISNMKDIGAYDDYDDLMFIYRTSTSYGSYASDYTINFVTGSQHIDQRDLTIQTLGGTKIYDGLAFGYGLPEFGEGGNVWIAAGSLALGHTITYDRESFVKISEDYTVPYENKLTNIIIKDEYGNDVTKNYNIIKIWGEVIIYEE